MLFIAPSIGGAVGDFLKIKLYEKNDPAFFLISNGFSFYFIGL